MSRRPWALRALPWSSPWRRVSLYLPPLNFITLHYLYFLWVCLLTSVVFWGSSTPAFSISYTDSLFLVISAMTEAGLNTVDLSTINTFQQCLLCIHIAAGSAIFVSIFVIHVRKWAFEKRFGALLESQREQARQHRTSLSMKGGLRGNLALPIEEVNPGKDRETNASLSTASVYEMSSRGGKMTNDSDGTSFLPVAEATLSPAHRDGRVIGHDNTIAEHITSEPKPFISPSNQHKHSKVFSFTGVEASPLKTSLRQPGQSNFLPRDTFRTNINSRPRHTMSNSWHSRHFLTRDVVGRNSQFHGLTREERERLGGVEYRAITLLSRIVPAYFILWQLLGGIGIGAWMAYNAADITKSNGINPWWNGVFNTISAFNNSGMSLLDANMVPFQTATYPVITMGLLILAGNTAFPVFLRLIFWTIYRLTPDTPYWCVWKDTLKFILDHPRRVYINMFPSAPTWWLLMTLIVLNGLDWISFELLNLNNDAVTSIPRGSRILDGLFQALAVRSGGFYIVPISSLRIGVQVLYIIMMYISVYPVVITMRNSNVYEERSLGIYSSHSAENGSSGHNLGPLNRLKKYFGIQPTTESRAYFIRQQMRGQLAHDLSWLAVAIFLIVCIESDNFNHDPITYSVFNVMFEVVSGYGCVGISTGLPNESYSFSGGWHITSKLILCAVMLRGRHRGLPVAIDKAVLLPTESLAAKEEEDHELRKGISQ